MAVRSYEPRPIVGTATDKISMLEDDEVPYVLATRNDGLDLPRAYEPNPASREIKFLNCARRYPTDTLEVDSGRVRRERRIPKVRQR